MCRCLGKDMTESQGWQIGPSGVVTASALIDLPELDDELCCGRGDLQIEEFVSVAREAFERAPHHTDA